ncbi:apolipoprotein N-acyltransferase [Saccharobesus litoralis]|uniref:Apolipoprotein N-acyltransferase n=1 Tax=Saccharobesus litoralis TaxID=2172099 RepID=A0A2S0VXZ3_9ALTE|nr:apolipoprotein N-acyltransferase [Saccharobesus litoralis]
MLCLLLMLAGSLSPLAFSPYEFWLLPLAQFSLLLFILDKYPHFSAFKLGWAFGLGWFASGLSWVHVSIDQFGGLPLAVSALMVLLLGAYLALFSGLAAWLASRFSYLVNSRILLFAPAWALTEWLRSFLLTGFPWLSLGYSQLSSPFASWLPILGEYGTSVIVVLCLSCLVVLSRQIMAKQILSRSLILTMVIMALATLLGHTTTWYQVTDKKVELALVQGNIEQQNRWAPEKMWPTMLKYLDLSRPHYEQADIIIWPEAAVPVIEKHANDYLSDIDKAVSIQKAALVTGVVDYNFDKQSYFNSMISLGIKQPEDTLGHYQYDHSNRYSKHHLLPIGEFVPFESLLRPLAPIFDLPHSSFKRGDFVQDNLIAKGFHLLPALCYEIVFPEQIRANITPNTDFILTLSNDAWFGSSVGPHQHLQIARMRAKEFGIPVVRVTNNGITAIVNAEGDIVAQAPQFEEAVVNYSLAINQSMTPFLYWGNWPVWILCAVGFSFLMVVNRKRAVNNSPVVVAKS